MSPSSGKKNPGGGQRPGAKPPTAKETTKRTLPILLLAAGASTRMRGGDKLLEDVNGEPCVREMARRAIATGQPVFVTLPAPDHPRAACLSGLDLTQVIVPDAPLGMSRSLQRGAAALPPDTRAVMILPADMPDISTNDMQAMIHTYQSAPNAALQASTPDGRSGHPTILGRTLIEKLDTLTGDLGAAPLIKDASNTRLYPLSDNRARLDLDTPEDWAAWRAQNKSN